MELIKIYEGNRISARELHIFLKVKSRFNDWINNRIKKYKFKEGNDFRKVTKTLVTQGGKQQGFDVILSMSMAKQLCMVENNELGKQARQYFIKAEETLQTIKDGKRLEAFYKLENTKEKLFKNIQEIGGEHPDYIQVDLAGRTILFNGEPLPDEELPTLLIKGRDFATEMTNAWLKEGEYSLEDAEELNKTHHQDIRETIINNMKRTPESFKSEEDIKKLSDSESSSEKEE